MYPRTMASEDAYPYLRQCLAPEYAELDAESLEAFMDERFGEGAAEHYDEYLEGFFDDLGRTFKKVAPVVANVAGGVARGAMSGASLGLPGIIGGALVGGAGTALSSYAKGPLRNVGNVLNTGTQIASQFSPMGRIGNQVGSMVSGLGQGKLTPQRLLQQGGQLLSATGVGGPAMAGLGSLLGGGRGAGAGGAAAGLLGLLGGGGGGAAGQLSSLLGRPEVQQAMMALNLGPAGRRSVPVGSAQTPVPTTAIAGLLQRLTAQAIDEAAALHEGAETGLGYMADANGEFVGDPAEEDDRAARVWDLLNQAQVERLALVARQRPRPEPRATAGPRAEDWHALLTEDLVAGIGEGLDEYDGEDWADSAEDSGLVEEAEDAGFAAEDWADDIGEDLAEDAGEGSGEWQDEADHVYG